jgi:hypothetical protein
MKFLQCAFASISTALLLAAQGANAQNNSVENFAVATLKVEKAHVIEGIYYLTQILPHQCHDENIEKVAAEFAKSNRELVERVNASPIMPMVRDSLEKTNAASKEPAQIARECAQTFAVLKSFDSEPGRQNAGRMLQTMKKEIIVKTN